MSNLREVKILVANINEYHMSNGYYLKLERENDFLYVRLYKGESCDKTLLGGYSPKEMLIALRAFRGGMFLLPDLKNSLLRLLQG